ncbi:MAG: hypothetical protein MJ252_29735 [archaeon]|nr:hypothetical protein [archaeon]
METEEKYKEIIEVLSSIKSKDGSSDLLSHLEAMNKIKIELNDDKRYYDLFEDISCRLKSLGYYENEKLHNEALHKFLGEFGENVKKSKKLLEKAVKVDGDEEKEVDSVTYIPDYHSLFKKISWCGVGLSERESFLLLNSLRNLAVDLPEKLTFFGKIYGTQKDYYVAEATGVDPEEMPEGYEPPAGMEIRKEEGVNKNVFFVTNDLTEKWKPLPDITPDQLVASRNIRYNFTGDLERKIVTNPHFNGQEKHLLHCQLSRIYHGTKLVPSVNHYIVSSPEEPFMPLTPNTDADPKPKELTHDDIVDLGKWIHYPPGILKQGRIKHFINVPEGFEGNEEDFTNAEKAKDPFDKRIKPVIEDKPIIASSLTKIKITPWKIQQSYESDVYINPYIKILKEGDPDYDPSVEQKDNKVDYSIVCVKSLLWPGSFNFYFGKEKECHFFYFGNGQKFIDTETDGPFVYKSFPKIPFDEPDYEDQPEPNGEPEPKEGEEEGEAEAEENKAEPKEGDEI